MAPRPAQKSILALPLDLIVDIFSMLPIIDLASLALVNRRFKIMAYNDKVYQPKLRHLGLLQADEHQSIEHPQYSHIQQNISDKHEDDSLDSSNGSNNDDVLNLSCRLKQLPGGHFLSSNTTYLETGTLWGGEMDNDTPSYFAEIVTKESPELRMQTSLVDAPKITANLPDMKNSVIIGAGGLKAALRGESAALHVMGGMSKSRSKSGLKAAARGLKLGRDALKQCVIELKPYFLDFKNRQRDSRVFRDYKDFAGIATILRRLRLFGQANILLDVQDINFSLETTIEWFESMILGQFEVAYDKSHVSEMRKNAFILYQLNKGAACVDLFISKNPIFFDETFNPTLVASKLPSLKNGNASQGYVLADDFAKFMDHMLSNCQMQVGVIAQVFPADMDVLTEFVDKVFDASISEYLRAVLNTAKGGEGIKVYLHTLASSIHCCTQFITYLGKNGQVPVNTECIKKAMASIFIQYTDNFIDLELEFLESRFATEIEKWTRAKQTQNTKKKAVASLADQAAQRKNVMSSFKAVLWSPVTITKLAVSTVSGSISPIKASPIHDVEIKSPTSIPPMIIDDAVTYQLNDNSLNSQISIEFVLHVLHMNKECLGRVLVVTSATDMTRIRRNVEQVFVSLLKCISEKHVKPAFEVANQRLSSLASESTTDQSIDSYQFFELVHIADLVSQMVDVYYQEDVKCWIDESDFLSEIVMEKKAFVRLLDNQVASGMDKSIQVLVNQVENVMNRESVAGDYYPVEANYSMDVKPTKACLKVIQCIEGHTKILAGVADKHTLEVFCSEIAVRTFNVIIKNLKSRQVSQLGAMQVIWQVICFSFHSDLNRYYDWAYALKVGSVTKLFSVLKEVGNLFLAEGGAELKSLVNDLQMYHGALRLEDVLELLASRADYRKIQKYVESKECVVM